MTKQLDNIHWVVTEFGAVNLFGKDLVERANLLKSIVHPEHLEMLEKRLRSDLKFRSTGSLLKLIRKEV